MNNEIEIGTDPRQGHRCILKNSGESSYVSFRAWSSKYSPNGVGIATTHNGGTVDSEGAMMVAQCIVHAVQDADPDNFDALWMGLVASIRAARMPQMTITVDPAQTYRHGLVPTCDEDTTLDKCNQADEEYFKQYAADHATPAAR